MITSNLQEFISVIPKADEIMGIDFGTKRIGTAISKLERKIVFPLNIIDSRLDYLVSHIRNNFPCALVLGWPLNADGTKGKQALIVENFAMDLVLRTKLPIFLEDERMTSKAADEILYNYNAKKSLRYRKNDTLAASLILESVINRI